MGVANNPGEKIAERPTTGIVLGKFMPPHSGHLYLVNFARNFVDKLTVIVGSLKREPIPGELRVQWMRELFPDVEVLHLQDENPQLPHEHPDFWQIWRDSLLRLVPQSADYLFAGEAYGVPLSKIIGARFIPTAGMRDTLGISATKVRSNPSLYWDQIPDCVRRYYLKRVCVFGPESTGKSTLAANLAAHYKTVHVPEFARTWLERVERPCAAEDMLTIAKGQAAAEDALAHSARGVLFTDTDPLATTIWSEELFGGCETSVWDVANSRRCDLYLLCDADVPWVADPVRYFPEERQAFFERCKQRLEERGLPYVEIRGSWEERFATATTAVDKLLGLTPDAIEGSALIAAQG